MLQCTIGKSHPERRTVHASAYISVHPHTLAQKVIIIPPLRTPRFLHFINLFLTNQVVYPHLFCHSGHNLNVNCDFVSLCAYVCVQNYTHPKIAY